MTYAWTDIEQMLDEGWNGIPQGVLPKAFRVEAVEG